MMKKIFNYKLIAYFVILGLVLSCVSFWNFANAYSSTTGNLKVEFSGDPPLFNEENWKPGDEINKEVTITNLSSTNSQDLGIVALEKIVTPASGSMNLAQVLNITVKYNSFILYEDSLADLYEQGEVYLTTLAPLVSINLDLIINMNEDADNEYQGLNTEFDFSIGFTEVSAPIPTGGPDIGVPFLAPTFLGTVIGGILGEGIGELTPPDIDEGEIKGEKEGKEEAGVEEESEEILCFWWWVLLLSMLVLLLLYYYYIKDKDMSVWFIISFIIAVFIYLLHEYLHNFYNPVPICNWFWLGTLIVLGATTAYYYFYLRKDKGHGGGDEIGKIGGSGEGEDEGFYDLGI